MPLAECGWKEKRGIREKTGIAARVASVAAMPAALKSMLRENFFRRSEEPLSQLAAASDASAERQSLSAMRGTVGNCRTEDT